MTKRGLTLLLLAGASVVAAALIAAANTHDLILYNPSPSVPPGLYVRAAERIAPGVFVTVRARDVAPEEAGRRDFTDPTDRFIKRVAAVGGVRVCGDGQRVVVGDGDSAVVVAVLGADEQRHAGADGGGDDRHAGADDRGHVDLTAGGHDRHHAGGDGRALVGWRGCRILADDEVLLLGDTADSFDGRYWGPVNVGLIEGVWRRF